MSEVSLVRADSSKTAETLVFTGAGVDDIADKVAVFLETNGYALETGSKAQGVYGQGSAVGHAFFGALSGRMKVNVTIGEDGDNVTVVLAKGMSGAWGGLIAAARVRKKFEMLAHGLQGAVLG